MPTYLQQNHVHFQPIEHLNIVRPHARSYAAHPMPLRAFEIVEVGTERYVARTSVDGDIVGLNSTL